MILPMLMAARLANRLLRLRLAHRDVPPLAAANLHALAHLDENQPAAAFTYTVVDLETTGLDIKQSRIVSIGAFKLSDQRIHLGHYFDQLVNPGGEMAVAAIKVHGIVPAMLASAPNGPAVLDDFLRFLGNDILVAHPAWFDSAFLNRLMQARYGFRLQNLVIDSRQLCERTILTKRLPALPRKPGLLGHGAAAPERHPSSLTIEEIAHQLGIRIYRRHSAVGDALATAMIVQHCLSHLAQNGRGRLGDLIRAGTI